MIFRWLLLFCCAFSLSSYAQTGMQHKNSKDFVLGMIDEVYSNILKEDRVLNIYLPADYDSTQRYPVIYLLDGAADEDFIHVVGLVQYNTFPWINQIPPSIVIGIANTNRKRDFTSATTVENDKKLIPVHGGSDKFINFIAQELQPYINSKYKTNGNETLIGQSLGGLLATEILFTSPQLFERYIIISPSLWWNDGALLRAQPSILQVNYKQSTDIYIGVGKEGSIDGKHIMEDDAKLLAEKLQKAPSQNIKVYFDYLPAEDHATVTHPALFNAFRMLYPKTKE